MNRNNIAEEVVNDLIESARRDHELIDRLDLNPKSKLGQLRLNVIKKILTNESSLSDELKSVMPNNDKSYSIKQSLIDDFFCCHFMYYCIQNIKS